jgi:ABC-type transport system involved in multi-copper enzyme maturation permease subunit
MRNIWTIAKREYDNYFNSPLAYVVLAIFLPLGVYFALIMFSAEQAFRGGGAPEATPINWLVRLFDDLPQPGAHHALCFQMKPAWALWN